MSFRILYLGLLKCWTMAVQNCDTGFHSYRSVDCQDVKDHGHSQSGLYHVTPLGTCSGFDVYCDMTTDGGGWLVFQRRMDGSVDFYMGWEDYQFGFGNKTGEFWLGNYPLYLLLSQGHYELRVDLSDQNGNTRYALYKIFQLGNPTDSYRLFVSGYSGDAGDGLGYHSGFVFSTYDRDSTTYGDGCATFLHGAWWYNDCHHSHLNGVYGNTAFGVGVNWFPWLGQQYSLKTSEMKIRKILIPMTVP